MAEARGWLGSQEDSVQDFRQHLDLLSHQSTEQVHTG